ncbi:hypothetical protein A7318_09085 [Pseudomonas lurida]|uniref:hypothetical protein n=1 Tax=Pseudomonas lurida TaxID=244566 RepID=UPI00083CDEDE|nr:hypothetical protein [Pseudomonas lurida]AOE78725.1 hypothetical protein A7318_09085 [Pseudomonas lurida]
MNGVKEFFRSSFSFALKTFWVCFFLSLFFVLLVLILKFGSSLKSSDAASWVQAIGSIAAIVAAIVIAGAQSRRMETQSIESNRVVLEALISIADRARHAVLRLHEQTSPNRRSAEDVAYVEASYHAFVSIDMLKLPTVAMLNQVMIIRSNLEVALQQASLTHEYVDTEAAENAHSMVYGSGVLIAGAVMNLKLLR